MAGRLSFQHAGGRSSGIRLCAERRTQFARRMGAGREGSRVSRHRHRHVRREGRARRRRPARSSRQASRELALSHPAPLWSEQDPDAWVDAAIARRRRARRRRIRAKWPQVRGIGLSGQMHGATLLDARRPGAAPVHPLERRPQRMPSAPSSSARWPALRAITGNIAMPGFTAPKLLWVREHEPRDLRSASPRCCCPRPTCAAADRRDGRGHVRRRRHALARRRRSAAGPTTLLAATGLDRDQMPRLVEGSAAVGAAARAELARRWGMRARVVVAGGAGDNAAGAVGVGAVRRATPSCRSAPRACCSASTDALRARRRARPCTPSATRFPTPGTRWA